MPSRHLAVWLVLAALVTAQSERRPNVVFIFTDDHGAQAISAYGSQLMSTPNIDRLAREGALFENCFCTNAICAPSRAVILTGRHSHRNGVLTNAEVFDGTQATLPKILRASGYQTAIVGKWHLKSDPTGFDHWEVLRGQGPYYNPLFLTPNGNVRNTGYTTDLITDRAIAWLEHKRDADRPFLLMVQHKAPHRNWQPAPRHLRLFADREIPAPPTLFDDGSGRGPAARAQEMTIEHHLSPHDLKLAPQGGFTAEQETIFTAAYAAENEAFHAAELTGRDRVNWMYQRYAKDYLRCVAAVDENIGRLLDWIDARRLTEDTIVVYSSDQGWFLGEHGWYDKRWIYEESLRMPLIVRWPGRVAAGSRLRAFASNLDFAPTLLDAAGVPAPAEMQGASLLPLLAGRIPADWRRSHYYAYHEFPGVHAVAKHYGVRTDRYKLIRFPDLDVWELYDLQTDPDELTNVADRADYAAVRANLVEELARLRRTYGDDGP